MSSILLVFFGLAAGLNGTSFAEAPGPACLRFRVHLATELPAAVAAEKNASKPLPADLAKAVDIWKSRIGFLKNDERRERWLACIRQFIFTDSDQDGIPDWTALVDGRPSRTLFPMDPDMDGDGLANVLDPDPYNPGPSNQAEGIPQHLKIAGENGPRQKKIWQEQGVLVVNHSDAHIADALDIALSVLRSGSIHNWSKKARGIDVLYAFGNRSPEAETAAFHPDARAISIPGRLGFGTGTLGREQRCRFRSSVLHELGHALLFGTLSAGELKEKAVELGGWRVPPVRIDSVFSAGLFDFSGGRSPAPVSEYASTNVHEWFAESFAAYVWKKESWDQEYCRAFDGPALPPGLGKWIESVLARAR